MMLLTGAFPGLRLTTELTVAGNNLVSAFTKVSGTHHGEFMGIPATAGLAWSTTLIPAGSPATR